MAIGRLELVIVEGTRMRAMCVWILTLSVITLPVWAQDDKAYEIKLKPDAVGDRIRVTKSDVSQNTATIELSGQKKENKEKKTVRFSYTEEVLERDAKAKLSTKLKRTYTQAEKTVDGKKSKFSYVDKTVLIKRVGDKFVFAVDGVELDEEDAEDLDEEFNKKGEIPLHDEDLLPKKPVKVGETWNIDTAMVARSFESVVPFTLDVPKSKVTGKLLKVFTKDGKQYGTIETKLKFVVKEFKLDGQEMELKPESVMEVTSVVDQCIDGSSHSVDDKSTIKMDLIGEIPNGSLRIGATAKLTRTIEDVGKK